MIRRLVKGLAVCGGLYLGLKAWMHYQAYIWLEAAKTAYSVDAAFQYSWMNASPALGEITLYGVEINPFQLRDAIKADRLTLKVGGMSQWLMLGHDTTRKPEFSWPDTLSVDVEQLQLPVTDRWSSYLHNPFPALASVVMPPCGDRQHFTAEDVKAMGWTHFVVDGRMDLDYQPGARTLNVNQYLSIQDGMSLKLSLGLSAFDWPQQGTQGSQPPAPHLQGLDLRIKDGGGLSRINHFCAGPTGVAADDYPLAAFRNTQDKLNKLGIKLGEGMTAGLKGFYRGGQLLHLKINPPEGFDLATWLMQAPEKVSGQLPVYFAVDDRVVIDPYYEIRFEQLMPALFPAPEPEKPLSQPPPKTSPDTAAQRKSYSEVEKETLALYVGFPVKITHQDGKITTGVLGEVSPYSVDVRVPMANGDVVFHVVPRDIKTVEVYQ